GASTRTLCSPAALRVSRNFPAASVRTVRGGSPYVTTLTGCATTSALATGLPSGPLTEPSRSGDGAGLVTAGGTPGSASAAAAPNPKHDTATPRPRRIMGHLRRSNTPPITPEGP